MIEPHYDHAGVRLFLGDCRAVLADLPSESVQCCVTSPPYWSTRVYGAAGEVGSEIAPAEYVAALVEIFASVRRVVDDAGSLWLNLGDSFAASGKGGGGSIMHRRKKSGWSELATRTGFRGPPTGYKHKDLTLLPFHVTDALRADGWYLRQTIIWSKRVATEPPRLDRPSGSHEYLFLFTKERHSRVRDPGDAPWWFSSVWEIASEGFAGHPCAMPQELVRRCLRAATAAGDVVIDPFVGACTVPLVAKSMERRCIGIDLLGPYLEIGADRVAQDALALEAAL